MSVVGAFPGIDWKRRTIRGPINILDKSTVVSICPKVLDERKPTIQPGHFHIDPGSFEKPSILVVGPSSWWFERDEESPLLEIPNSSIQIADAIVRDYCNGILASNMADSMPGFFYVNGCKQNQKGEVNIPETLAWIKSDFKSELENARQRQNNWYSILVKMADSLWARSNGNPLAIGDDMRLAAKELGLQERKDWMRDFQMVDMVRCKACGSLKNPAYPVCVACKSIDQEHPMAKTIKFAQ